MLELRHARHALLNVTSTAATFDAVRVVEAVEGVAAEEAVATMVASR